MAKPKLRMVNSSRWQKHTTVMITKALKEEAELLNLNLKQMVKDKLQESYVKNVKASYTPRTIRGQEIVKYNKEQKELDEQSGGTSHKKKLTYRHTGIFANSIYTKIDGNYVKVMIRDEQYPDGASTTQVYKWLTEGTEGGTSPYPYIKKQGDNYSTGWSRNFSTPAHLFEEFTRLEMQGYIDSLKSEFVNSDAKDIQAKYKRYLRKRK